MWGLMGEWAGFLALANGAFEWTGCQEGGVGWVAYPGIGHFCITGKQLERTVTTYV